MYCSTHSSLFRKKTPLWMFVLLPVLITGLTLMAQQKGDPTYTPNVPDPAYKAGQGPTVHLDEAHHNFHTLDGRYQPFGKLLTADGYNLKPFKTPFTAQSLSKTKILVISNALHERNVKDWSLPTPSAFTDQEIDAVSQWVKKGGSLLLIADHMPLAGAAEKMAAKFGFKCHNGFVFHSQTRSGTITFTLKEKTLCPHKIIEGRKDPEKIHHVVTFTGQAFTCPKEAKPLLVFPPGYTILLPKEAWVFDDKTPRKSPDGMAQGAVLQYGNGRIAIFGEAAQFTSQLAGGKTPIGMTSPEASHNQQFLLNVIHWLDGIIE